MCARMRELFPHVCVTRVCQHCVCEHAGRVVCVCVCGLRECCMSHM